ncbi:MAG: hypothetical protein QOH88_3625 [Verrucomicrobiota bacterium]|jgi:predicted dithiol-disulfide oxidoreductase (DUF899 family)
MNKIASREEWLKARKNLLAAEKEHTHRSDELARQRQQLPWVRIDKEYRFDTDDDSLGTNSTAGGCEASANQSRGAGDSVRKTENASLADLFRGRSQLLIYHFMFGPDYTAGCPACSAIADGFNGVAVHLANHDVMLWAVSRAPLAKLQTYKQRMGWTFPWASSFRTDFNYDFSSSFTEEQEREGVEYNYRREPPYEPPKDPDSGAAMFARMSGTDHAHYTREAPGMSAFALEDGVIYHTYSAYARGLDGLWSMYQWLDRAPKGRNEDGLWFRRHDEYEK